MIDYYDQCYFFILPSYYLGESFGRSWVEAMARKKPIISTNTANLKYIIRDEFNGILVDPSVQSVEKGIDKALKLDEENYKLLCKNAGEFSLQFKQKNIINYTLNIVNNLIKT